jgi:WD40 repeat protein
LLISFIRFLSFFFSIYFISVLEPFKWSEIIDDKSENRKQVERRRFSPSASDIVDLKWSPDSSYIIIGALEQKPEIIRIAVKEKQRENSVTLPPHGNYVQGVAWDPWNKFVVTQSADRSVKVHKVIFFLFFSLISFCSLISIILIVFSSAAAV